MNERVLILRDAIVKITQIMAGTGIQVTQRGISAYVQSDATGKPILVNLPYLPDNATEELCEAIQGFLDHEVAHIFYSDFSLLGEAEKTGAKSVMNAIEDTRIERLMAKRFAGSAGNLATTGKFFLDEYIQPQMEEAAAAGDANKVLGLLMVPLLRAMSGQQVFKEFMANKMHIVKPIHDKIADLEDQIANAETTRDCLNLAQEITKRLKGEEDPEDNGDQPGQDKSGGAGSESGGKPQKGKGKGEKPKSKPAPKPAPEPEDESEEGEGAPPEDGEPEGTPPIPGEEPPAAPGEDDSEDEGDGSGAPAPGEEDEDKDGEDGAAPAPGEDDAPPPEDDETEIDITDGLNWDAIDKEAANDFDAALSKVITQSTIDSAKTAPYLVYSKENDVIEPLHVGREYQPAMFTALAEAVEHMVGPLQKDLERAISARSASVWEAGLRRGRLNPSSLSRLASGDDRVFRKRHDSTSKDVAVSLVIDMSGSMGGQKINLAAQSAYALSQVLERLNISHEVICFTTREPHGNESQLRADEAKMGRRFTRAEGLYMPIIKDFKERTSSVIKSRFGWLPNTRCMQANVDGECVEIAARRLLARREKGKVMIVLSDGEPAGSCDRDVLMRHLKDTVTAVTKAGVNVVGIGIQSSAVSKFYPKHVVINNVSELPDRVMKELRHLLVQ